MSTFSMERIETHGVSISPHHYINGQRVPSPRTFEVRTPLCWPLKLADVSRGDRETANQAVSAATDAFPVWSALTSKERAIYLNRLADLIEAKTTSLAHIECLDMAMLLRSLEARVIPRAARNFRAYAELADSHVPRQWTSNGTDNTVLRDPSGPAVIITPWNAPFMLATWKCAPALAAGNTVVLKPAEWSPLTASMLGDLIDEAQFPPGVFNIVQGFGSEVGSALVADRRVRRISFTGSPEVARLIGTAAARNIVPFTAELGGKNPFMVFADADIDAAARTAAAQYDDSGQVCLAGTRLLVEASVAVEFLHRFNEHVDKHVLGDSRQPETTISPIIHPHHLSRIQGFVERSKAGGDRVLRGGAIAIKDSLWFEPTLIEPRSNEAEIVQNEVFGPVLTLQTFATEDEAITLANSTRYGLSAIVYTGDEGRAKRIGQAVRGGTVWVNCYLVRDLSAPFGGCGLSGIGREGGDYALDFHSDLKTLQIRDG